MCLRLQEAALHYRRVIEIDPCFAQAYNNLAVIYYHQEKYDLALDHLKKAEQLGVNLALKEKGFQVAGRN